jgi:flagellar assembly factor FliW
MSSVDLRPVEVDVPLLEFPAGIPGFSDAHVWALVQVGDDPSPFRVLTCIDRPGIELLVMEPFSLFPDYEPELSDDDAERLGISRADEVAILAIVNLANGVEAATVNLLAPLVVNTTTNVCAQVVLEGEQALRAPLDFSS